MEQPKWLHATEQFVEDRLIFGARWLLMPAYLMLVLSLAVLAAMSIFEFVQLVTQLHIYDESSAIAQVLVIVDLVLVMNLVLMILFVGYMNFVSVIHPSRLEDWPKWMGSLDYSGLKIQVMGSVVAISAIKLLRAFLDVSTSGQVDQSSLLWLTIIHIAFVISVVVLAISNKFKVKAEDTQFHRLIDDDEAS